MLCGHSPGPGARRVPGRRDARGCARQHPRSDSSRGRPAPPAPVGGWKGEGSVSTGAGAGGGHFRGAAKFKVRQYNPIHPFAFRGSFFNYLTCSHFCQGAVIWGSWTQPLKARLISSPKPNTTTTTPISALKGATVFSKPLK